MGGEVVQLRPGLGTDSARKAAFLDALGQSFDEYAKDYGEEPDAVVYVLGGVSQTARIGWQVNGDSQGAATSMLALAHAVLMRELVNPNS